MKRDALITSFRIELSRRQKAKTTIDQYVGFAERYLAFCAGRKFESPEVAIPEFLGSLTPCSVALQKGALCALAGKNGFYPCHGREIGQLPEWTYAKRPVRIPVWTTAAETESIIKHLDGTWSIFPGLMFGSGLRIGETVALRWRAIDFERGTISIWSGKGDKCRIAPLSKRMIEPLLRHRERCRALWECDRRQKRPGVAPVDQLVKKSPNHGLDWPFFWVFPAAGESCDPKSGIVRRHHIHEKSFSKVLRKAVASAGVSKRVTSHSFRHGFATAYLLAGGNLRELQERMGHDSIETTMIYLHCLPHQFDRIGSPWDVTQPSPQIVPFLKTA